MPDITVVEVIWRYLTILTKWTMDNLLVLNAILAIVIVFFQRRDPKTVWTWLLVLYFIPVLGFILYLFLGQNLHKRKMFRMKEMEDSLNSQIQKQEEIIFRNEFNLSDKLLEDYRDLVLYNLEAFEAAFCEDN